MITNKFYKKEKLLENEKDLANEKLSSKPAEAAETTETFEAAVQKSFDLSFASTETKFKNPITKTQNNIVIFGFFHKKMILSFWLFLK